MIQRVLSALSTAAADILSGPVAMTAIVEGRSFDVRGSTTSLYIGTKGSHAEREALGMQNSGRLERLFLPKNLADFGIVIDPTGLSGAWEIRASGAMDVFRLDSDGHRFQVRRFTSEHPGLSRSTRGGEEVDDTVIHVNHYSRLSVGAVSLFVANQCFAQVVLLPPQSASRELLRGDRTVGVQRISAGLPQKTAVDTLMQVKIEAAAKPGSQEEVNRHNYELARRFFEDYMGAARSDLNSFSASGNLQFAFHPITGKIISFCEKAAYGDYYALAQSLGGYPRAIWKPEGVTIEMNGQSASEEVLQSIRRFPEIYERLRTAL